MGGGGGDGGEQPTQVPSQSYRDEGNRNVSAGGSSKKALGSAWLQSQRQATPMGDEGFLGQKATLG